MEVGFTSFGPFKTRHPKILIELLTFFLCSKVENRVQNDFVYWRVVRSHSRPTLRNLDRPTRRTHSWVDGVQRDFLGGPDVGRNLK